MRVIASADIHGFAAVAQWVAEMARAHGADAMVLAGDLLGVPDGPPTVEEAQRQSGRELAALLETAGIPVLYIMGNDDQVPLEPSSSLFHSLHGRRVTLDGIPFAGYRYSLPFAGGAFEKTEEGIREDLRTLEYLLDNRTIFVTHSPAYGILDGANLGSVSILQAVENRSVRAHIHGHIHGCFGRDGRHFNVASGGRRRAMLVELPGLEHKVLGTL